MEPVTFSTILGKAAGLVAGTVGKAIVDRAKRTEIVIKSLKRWGFDPDTPPATFEYVYVYALVEYGLDKPKKAVDFFRQDFIIKEFRRRYEQNNYNRLQNDVTDLLEWNEQSQALAKINYDLREELANFLAAFEEVVDRTRTMPEVRQERKLDQALENTAEISSKLDGLAVIQTGVTELLETVQRQQLPAAKLQGNLLEKQLGDWFKALNYQREPHEHHENRYFEWIIQIPTRRSYDRVVVRGFEGKAEAGDVDSLNEAVAQHRADEGWLVAMRRVSPAARNATEETACKGKVYCYTFDELLDETADFSHYFDWLETEVTSRGIDKMYVPLGCQKKEGFFAVPGQGLATSVYDEKNGWLEGYIRQWLDDPDKEHISVLGEFGMGKTWFTLHFAWEQLQDYKKAKANGTIRPRLPLVIPLRDYARAVSVESLFSEFFFRKHEIGLPGYSAFEQLNRMGKLLLLFDGFDEMADKVDRQKVINNFWELARVVVPGSKAILTSRTERFPTDKESRELLSAELKASTAALTGEPPQFEIVELIGFNKEQIEKVLSFRAKPETVKEITGNKELMDLAQRPVMIEYIIDALPDIEAGKPVDMARVYLYAVRRKMEQNIKEERTFTSLADKLFFMCELSWEMLSTEQMSLNYKLFPDRLRQLFGHAVQDQTNLDHWHYDMMGQTMFTRNSEGDYKPAHRSLLEFFVAYKFAAELGILADDFTALARSQSNLDTQAQPQEYTWSEYFKREIDQNGKVKPISPLNSFKSEEFDKVRNTFGNKLLSNVALKLLQSMVNRSERSTNCLLDAIIWTRGRSEQEVGFVGGNSAILVTSLDRQILKGRDLSCTNLSNATIRGNDLSGVILSEAVLKNIRLYNCDMRGSDLRQVTLTKARLESVKLDRSNLTQADMSQSSLSKTSLKQVCLRESNLSKIVIDGCLDVRIYYYSDSVWITYPKFVIRNGLVELEEKKVWITYQIEEEPTAAWTISINSSYIYDLVFIQDHKLKFFTIEQKTITIDIRRGVVVETENFDTESYMLWNKADLEEAKNLEISTAYILQMQGAINLPVTSLVNTGTRSLVSF